MPEPDTIVKPQGKMHAFLESSRETKYDPTLYSNAQNESISSKLASGYILDDALKGVKEEEALHTMLLLIQRLLLSTLLL